MAVSSLLLFAVAVVQAPRLDYASFLLGAEPVQATINAQVDREARRVTVVGDDLRRPTIPFDVDWGDGAKSNGFFPLSHAFGAGDGFWVQMTSHYAGGGKAVSRLYVSFKAPGVPKSAAKFPVTVPAGVPELKTVLYPPNPDWRPYRAGADKAVVQNLLSRATEVISGYFDGDHEGFEGGEFPQVLMADAKMEGGGYSVWFTRPAAFVLGHKAELADNWSSAFHEIGHNVSLNAPRACRIGGRFDGSGNIMLAESVAQILQHATGKHLVDQAGRYGIDSTLAGQIAASCERSMLFLAREGRAYEAGGCRFEAWNKPETPQDESMPTFMFMAYQFLKGIEENHRDWDQAAKRFMKVIRCLDEDLARKLDNRKPTPEAAKACAALMVAAASYGLDCDMRPAYRKAGFPVDDGLYGEIMGRVGK